MSNNIKLDT